jgi:hypothetical protein
MVNQEPMMTKTKNIMRFLETRSCDDIGDELTEADSVKFTNVSLFDE